MRKSPKPEFGLLSEYRVVFSGISVAAPFAAELYAEQGADVIWIENPHVLDSGRVSKKAGAGSRIDAICAVWPWIITMARAARPS